MKAISTASPNVYLPVLVGSITADKVNSSYMLADTSVKRAYAYVNMEFYLKKLLLAVNCVWLQNTTRGTRGFEVTDCCERRLQM
jgi:hypothetical protein